MHKNNRTLWTEGMFLGPQHFQQNDRFILNNLALLARFSGAHAYGVMAYELDSTALAEGKFALTRAAGLFPDGTAFNLPDDGELPTALLVDSDVRSGIISLSIPFEDQQDKDAAESRQPGSFSRYLITDRLVSDRHSPDSNTEETVFTAALWTRLSIAGDDHTAFHTIPLARVVEKRDDGSLLLDEAFFPCAMSLQATPILHQWASELMGLVAQRSTDLAKRIGNATASDSSQLNQLLLLQIMNRWAPLLKHHCESGSLHPESLYAELVQLAGEMATITQPDRLPREVSPYLHRDQYKSFSVVFEHLRSSLNWIPHSTTESIAVEHVTAGIYTAAIRNKELFNHSRFILAAKARATPDELSRRLPRQTTISSKHQLRDLVEAQAQGIEIQSVVTIPNSIPVFENFVYFELRDDDPLWQDIATSGDMALHIAGSYSDLEMQLWAVAR